MLLIIDDEANDRELVRISLGGHYQVQEAFDPAIALELVKDSRPDVVLLDLMLSPPIDPPQFIKTLQNLSPKTAVVVFSGSSNPVMIGAAIMAGADGFVAKPTGLVSREYMIASLDAAIIHRQLTVKQA